MQHPFGLLTVDLNALQNNWLRLRRELVSGAECGAVLKADAYGLGMAPVARALHKVGCQSFFVVTPSEGVALRSVLGDGPTIYLLQGAPPGQEALCLSHQLVPVLVSEDRVEHWQAFCDAQAVPVAERHAAIKLNTGMNRLGLELSSLHALINKAGALEGLGCRMLLSHLACADEPGHPLNGHQLQAFREALALVRSHLPQVRASLANSAATLQGAPWHFDLVRPGIALYGSNPTGIPEHTMEPVVRLQLPVIQSRRVAPGSRIGYGASYTAATETDLVAVAGGYGDGLFRSLGNRGHVWFNKLLPLVGRVSMDSMTADASDLAKAEQPRAGEMVELLGPHLGVDAVAEAAGTVAYEVLTRLTGRYDRCYHLDGRFFEDDA